MRRLSCTFFMATLLGFLCGGSSVGESHPTPVVKPPKVGDPVPVGQALRISGYLEASPMFRGLIVRVSHGGKGITLKDLEPDGSWEVELALPNDAIGTLNVMAVALYTDGEVRSAEPVSVAVDLRSLELKQLTLDSGMPCNIATPTEATVPLRLVGTYSDGSRRSVKDEQESVTYHSSDETVATVDEQGNATCLRPGKTTITATYTFRGDKYTATDTFIVPEPR